MRPHRVGAAGLALALVWAGASCAVIPTGGPPVSYEEQVQGDPLRKPYVRVVATEPRSEWTPQQVVSGFLNAMASLDDPGWKIARKYLTAEAARGWRPQVGVTVYDKGQIVKVPLPPDDAMETEVTLKGAVTGSIDGEGKYRARSRPGGESNLQSFPLIKTPQGWRITEVLNVLLLTEADIRRSYRPVKLYYLDHLQKGLVVDEVRIPVDPAQDFAESMVRRLLDGPTGTLKDAVSNALPAGTELRRVFTEDDKIIVDLNEAAANAISSGARGGAVDAMAAQIGWTLNQLTERWEVEVRVNGEPFYPDGSALRVGFDR
ncbi:GerMN domain-containing protein [Streptosporangium soli]|nr:GerMN domain-containing protein [Streptosporangium sp. KLBMP 9127]